MGRQEIDISAAQPPGASPPDACLRIAVAIPGLASLSWCQGLQSVALESGFNSPPFLLLPPSLFVHAFVQQNRAEAVLSCELPESLLEAEGVRIAVAAFLSLC